MCIMIFLNIYSNTPKNETGGVGGAGVAGVSGVALTLALAVVMKEDTTATPMTIIRAGLSTPTPSANENQGQP